jgi:hypothetical protein
MRRWWIASQSWDGGLAYLSEFLGVILMYAGFLQATAVQEAPRWRRDMGIIRDIYGCKDANTLASFAELILGMPAVSSIRRNHGLIRHLNILSQRYSGEPGRAFERHGLLAAW